MGDPPGSSTLRDPSVLFTNQEGADITTEQQDAIERERNVLTREMLAAEMMIRNLIVRYAPGELRPELDALAKQACLAHQYATGSVDAL